jgi:hypothetical protein
LPFKATYRCGDSAANEVDGVAGPVAFGNYHLEESVGNFVF